MSGALRKIGTADLVAGLAVMALGAFTIYEASTYQFGSIGHIGPGYFPVLLGVALVCFGLGIIVVEGVRNTATSASRPAFRATIAIASAICAFGLTIERFGLAPAIFAAAFLASMAEPEIRLLNQLVLALVLSAVSVLIFVVALGLPIEIVAW